MNHSFFIDSHIESELGLYAVGPIVGSCILPIPVNKTYDARGVTAHGIMIKDLQWTFAESTAFKNLLRLEISPDNWPSLTEDSLGPGLYGAYTQLKRPINIGRLSNRTDNGKEIFVEMQIFSILEFVCALLQAALIQLVLDSAAVDNPKNFLGFLRYILTLTIERQATQDGEIPSIIVRLGGKNLGTFGFLGTGFNSSQTGMAPIILNSWLGQRVKVDSKWGQGGEDEIAWSILAQLSIQANKSAHKMGIFTTLIGTLHVYRFERNVEIGEAGLFYVSTNLGDPDDMAHRKDSQTLQSFARHILAFLFRIILGEEDFRRHLQITGWDAEHVYKQAVHQEPQPLRQDFRLCLERYWSRMKSDIILACNRGVEIRQFIPINISTDILERVDANNRSTGHLFHIPFRLIHDVEDGVVMISPERGLVFKRCASFENESKIYDRLMLGNVQGVPTVVGFYKGKSCQMPGILMNYLGTTWKGPFTAEQLHALQSIIDALHKAGVHHHDLHEDNIVKGDDGMPRVIDFNLADDGRDCSQAECPDYLWLQEMSLFELVDTDTDRDLYFFSSYFDKYSTA